MFLSPPHPPAACLCPRHLPRRPRTCRRSYLPLRRGPWEGWQLGRARELQVGWA